MDILHDFQSLILWLGWDDKVTNNEKHLSMYSDPLGVGEVSASSRIASLSTSHTATGH